MSIVEDLEEVMRQQEALLTHTVEVCGRLIKDTARVGRQWEDSYLLDMEDKRQRIQLLEQCIERLEERLEQSEGEKRQLTEQVRELTRQRRPSSFMSFIRTG